MAGDGSRKKGWAEERQSPPLNKAQPLSGASNKRKGNQKIVKNGRQTVQANYGKQMSGRKILDIHGREARARPRPHYFEGMVWWWGEGKNLF